MKSLLSVLLLILIVAAIVSIYLGIENRQFLKRLSKCRNWHLSNVDNETNFNFFGTYEAALTEMRLRVPGAAVVQVDEEMSVIFFRIPSK